MTSKQSQQPTAALEITPASRVDNASPLLGISSTSDSFVQPRLIPLTNFPVRIGRSNDNHVLVQDIGMSRRSIAIVCENGRLEVEDLGQRLGVLVNGQQVDGRRTLEFGDVITFPNADVKLTIRATPEPPEEKTA